MGTTGVDDRETSRATAQASGRILFGLGLALGLALAAGAGAPAPAEERAAPSGGDDTAAREDAGDREILLQSTTSTQSSGLFEHILPRFTRDTGIRVRVVAVGTGQALANARNGDADVVLVHAPEAEREFVAAGFGVERHPVMHNDFVLVGPGDDPAGARGRTDAAAALERIAAARAVFVSRADESGTHRKEMALWKAAGVDPAPASGSWYRETGSGMGATLRMAVGMEAYTLVDRGTWLAFGDRGGLEILVEGDPRLFNPYSAILVNPVRHPHVKAAAGRAFIAWLTGPAGQAAIASHRVAGEPLFVPAAEAGGRGP